TFNNLLGATFDVQCDSSWTAINGSPITFTNAGTFLKSSGSGSTAFISIFTSLNFINTGTVHVESGTLDLACGGSGSGSFVVDAGTTLNFGAGTYNLTSTSSVTGAGTVSVAPGSASTTAGGMNWSGGTLNVLGSYNVNNTFIPSGAINFNSDASTPTLSLSSDP